MIYVYIPTNQLVQSCNYGIFKNGKEFVKFPNGEIKAVLTKDLQKTKVIVQGTK